MSSTATRWLALVGAIAVSLSCSPAAGAYGGPFAPVDRPGPALAVTPSLLAGSLNCVGDLAGSTVEPVLLVPATTVNSAQNFAWNYEVVLKADGIPYCTSDLPGVAQYNMTDIQNRADYLVYAIRTMYQRDGGRPIAMVGSSQGGEASRWPLRFWPDTRPMVSDVIALDSPNHGSTVVTLMCALTCAPSLWQQAYHSRYTQALNSGQETFAGISYTDISTSTDDFVEPNSPRGSTVWLHGPGQIRNVAIQSICPGTVAEHLLAVTINPIAMSLALDAITHPGPADPGRIHHSVCTDGPFNPAVPTSTAVKGFTAAGAQVAVQLTTAAHVAREPALVCYVFANCPGAARR